MRLRATRKLWVPEQARDDGMVIVTDTANGIIASNNPNLCARRRHPCHTPRAGIAKLDAACVGGSQRLACALADHVSLVLGSEHVKRQLVGPGHRQWRDRRPCCHQRGAGSGLWRSLCRKAKSLASMMW